MQRLMNDAEVTRLGELTAETLGRHMGKVIDEGLSARTENYARQIAVAFMSWGEKTRRIEFNPLTVVPKFDETKDRRRVRRPLTDEDLVRLLNMADERGRKAWYMAAVMAGLRKGDLQHLRWCDNFTIGRSPSNTAKPSGVT